MEKNKAAQELVKKRWSKTTEEERSQLLGDISRQGWSPENREKRLENAGRPLSPDRCPCGKMTKARAKARNHRCEAS